MERRTADTVKREAINILDLRFDKLVKELDEYWEKLDDYLPDDWEISTSRGLKKILIEESIDKQDLSTRANIRQMFKELDELGKRLDELLKMRFDMVKL